MRPLSPMRLPATPWLDPPADVLAALQSDSAQGLAESEVPARRKQFGANRLRASEPTPWLRLLLRQLRDVLVWLLVAAAVLSLAFGDTLEAIAVALVIAFNTALGFFTELRATRSMEALRRLSSPKAQVVRDGRMRTVSADELVPGDIVVLGAGDVIPADLRVVRATDLWVDESLLTGESDLVEKRPAPVAAPSDGAVDVADRSAMLHQGASVARGDGRGLVVATGPRTELGKIADLVAAAQEGESPLSAKLAELGRTLAQWAFLLAAIIAAIAWTRGQPWLLSVKMAIALAVATVPEGLPIVATLALARGMLRMARKNALIKRLAAVETLGATTTILTDKTGTLTENAMQVVAVAAPFRPAEGADSPRPEVRAILEAAFFASDPALFSLDSNQARFDPMERSLRRAADDDARPPPLLRAYPFEPALRMMGNLLDGPGGATLYVKGAPEEVMHRSDSGPDGAPLTPDQKVAIQAQQDALIQRGLRLLAIARRPGAEADAPAATAFDGLCYLGVVGFQDPPRASARDAVEAAREAGVSTIMVTGDHAETGRIIAESVHIVDDSGPRRGPAVLLGRDLDTFPDDRLAHLHVVARASPEQKHALLTRLQKQGQIVAMLGDGVNDAPALKRADIGVAMGQRGTEVAREAAKMVLQDDQLGTVVEAIAEGRSIFRNIRKFVAYLLSCNLSEVLVVGIGAAFVSQVLLTPLQILFLNLVTDVFPALALGFCRRDPATMHQGPRAPDEPLLPARWWRWVLGHGAFLAGLVFIARVVATETFGLNADEARTVVFFCLAYPQVVHVFNLTEQRPFRLSNEVSTNPWVWGAVALCSVLLALALSVPPVAEALSLSAMSARGWGLVAGASVLEVIFGRIWPPPRRPKDMARPVPPQ